MRDRFVDLQDLQRLFLRDVVVDADHNFLFFIERDLVAVRSFSDFALRVAAFDGGNHAAHGVDLVDVVPGAALDFIAGTQIRAPALSQKIGLEWAWRMLKEPRRLGPRYARCMAIVPRLLVRTIPQIVNARMRKAA